MYVPLFLRKFVCDPRNFFRGFTKSTDITFSADFRFFRRYYHIFCRFPGKSGFLEALVQRKLTTVFKYIISKILKVHFLFEYIIPEKYFWIGILIIWLIFEDSSLFSNLWINQALRPYFHRKKEESFVSLMTPPSPFSLKNSISRIWFKPKPKPITMYMFCYVLGKICLSISGWSCWKMCINGQNQFFSNNSLSIDIWILHKEQKLFVSEFYMCVPNLLKWIPAKKNPGLRYLPVLIAHTGSFCQLFH